MIIKKRVSLDFLGSDYKESYIEVSSVPMKDLRKLVNKSEELQEKDSSGALDFVIEEVTKRFISGSVFENGSQVEVKKENLEDFPAEVFITIFEQVTGTVSKNS